MAKDETRETGRDSKDAQLAALLVSAAIVVSFVLYWALQVQSVRELLALAYD